MVGDVKLDGDWVVVEGNWLRVKTLDLMLDAPQRRQSQQGLRRALVHNQQDGLTINYAGDYPDGVRIQGRVRLGGAVETQSSVDVGAQFKVRGRALARVEDPGTGAERIVLAEQNTANAIEIEGRGLQIDGGLQVRGEAYFDHPPRVGDLKLVSAGSGAPTPAGPLHREESLIGIINALRDEIAQLKARVATLEAQS